MHDMTIGQNKAVRRDDYARAGPGSRAVAAADIETHDAWPDPLDDLGHGLRIGVEKRIVRVCIVWQRIVLGPSAADETDDAADAAPKSASASSSTNEREEPSIPRKFWSMPKHMGLDCSVFKRLCGTDRTIVEKA